MRLAQIGKADVADRRQPVADEDRCAVEQQPVDEVGAQEGCRRRSAALHQQMVDPVQCRDLLRRCDAAPPGRRVAMGEQQAAITIAAIYQRQDQINSAGGYLRSLTDRAKAGKFSVWPMIMALLRAKLEASKAAGNGAEAAAVDLETAGKVVRTESRLEISDALRRSLDKPGRGS